jgi:hypothetical protein
LRRARFCHIARGRGTIASMDLGRDLSFRSLHMVRLFYYHCAPPTWETLMQAPLLVRPCLLASAAASFAPAPSAYPTPIPAESATYPHTIAASPVTAPCLPRLPRLPLPAAIAPTPQSMRLCTFSSPPSNCAKSKEWRKRPSGRGAASGYTGAERARWSGRQAQRAAREVRFLIRRRIIQL